MIEQSLFYIFSILIIISSIMVISSKNPVHSVLHLVLAYINASGLFLLLGVEYLALIFLIIYVGAVAILFIFTVMMLNLTLIQLRESFTGLVPIAGTIGLIFFIQILDLIETYRGVPLEDITTGYQAIDPNGLPLNTDWTTIYLKKSELYLIGSSLYVEYGYLMIVASIILLISMIGAILLTLEHSKKIKRQDLFKQIIRKHF